MGAAYDLAEKAISLPADARLIHRVGAGGWRVRSLPQRFADGDTIRI
jgi:hypothetical protein